MSRKIAELPGYDVYEGVVPDWEFVPDDNFPEAKKSVEIWQDQDKTETVTLPKQNRKKRGKRVHISTSQVLAALAAVSLGGMFHYEISRSARRLLRALKEMGMITRKSLLAEERVRMTAKAIVICKHVRKRRAYV